MQMIDRGCRDRLAELLRQLCSGAVDVNAYEKEAASLVANSNDQGVRAVFTAAEYLYDVDDGPLLKIRLLRKRLLPRALRHEIARSIAFLHSDLEYGWPEPLRQPNTHGFAYLILCALIASAGLFVIATMPLIGILCFAATAFLFFFARYHAWRIHQRWIAEQRQSSGLDYDFWPFRNIIEFDNVNKRPRLLSGRI